MSFEEQVLGVLNELQQSLARMSGRDIAGIFTQLEFRTPYIGIKDMAEEFLRWFGHISL